MKRTIIALALLSQVSFSGATEVSAAAKHLAAAVKFKTISYQAGSDPALLAESDKAFTRYNAFLTRTYPKTFKQLKVEWINTHSLLLTWKGSDDSLKPAMFIAHSDVVPVEPGTEGDWTHPAFSGVIADGIIYGRGTLDDKLGVIGWFEAIEKLLGDNIKPKRTIYFGFGHDEEISGRKGAGAIASKLRKRGVELSYLVDEGGFIIADHPLLKDRAVASVNVAEKGYLTLFLSASGEGGHSSMPPTTSTIAMLSEAMVKLQNNPFPARLVEPMRVGLEAIAPYSPGITGMLLNNLWISESLVLRELAKERTTNALIRTTTALTQFNAGVKENVVPQAAKASVNFRLLPGDTPDMVTRRVKEIIDNPKIEVSGGSWEQPPEPGSLDGKGFRHLSAAIQGTFPDTVVMPSLVSGATDTRHYAGLADDIYRFHGVTMSMAQTAGVHGTNEYISVDAFNKMIAFNRKLLRLSISGD